MSQCVLKAAPTAAAYVSMCPLASQERICTNTTPLTPSTEPSTPHMAPELRAKRKWAIQVASEQPYRTQPDVWRAQSVS